MDGKKDLFFIENIDCLMLQVHRILKMATKMKKKKGKNSKEKKGKRQENKTEE